MDRRPLALVLDLLVGVSAVAGGAMLVLDPSGQRISLSPLLLSHTPFRAYLLPGIVLAVAVGGSALCAAAANAMRSTQGPRWTALAGAILVGWVVGEVALIRAFHPLQPALLAVGLAQLGLGLRAAPRSDVTAKATAFLGSPRVLFVGLSSTPGDFSRMVADSLAAHGIEVVGVNPRGAPPAVFARVEDVPSVPTAALLMVPPAQAEAAVRACVAAGVRSVWFHRGAGPGAASPEAVALAEREGLTVITDACPMMFLEPSNWLHAAHRWHRGHAAPLVALKTHRA